VEALSAIRSQVRSGYDRRSLIALALLVSTGGVVGYRWSDLVDANGGMDWLLAGTWIWMAGLLTWSVTPRRDLVLLAVGFAGGGVIEWWGTATQIWTYFTLERPPLWILPAWPIAALAIDRMARLLTNLTELAAPQVDQPHWFISRLLAERARIRLMARVRARPPALHAARDRPDGRSGPLRTRGAFDLRGGSLLGIFSNTGYEPPVLDLLRGQVPPVAAFAWLCQHRLRTRRERPGWMLRPACLAGARSLAQGSS
jgi:hypothetical protein